MVPLSFARPLLVLSGAIVITSCSPSSTSTANAPNAGASAADADWLAYNRTLPGDRFSPLAEIDRTNVAQLKQICIYMVPEVSSLQTGPLVVGGAMYFTTDVVTASHRRRF